MILNTFLIVCSAADDVVATVGTEAWFDDLELIYNPVILDLTVFMEGPYDAASEMFTNLNPDHIPLNQPYNVAPWNYNGTESVASIPTDVVDWVMVEIRDASSAATASSFASIGRQAGFLLKDGLLLDWMVQHVYHLMFPSIRIYLLLSGTETTLE